MLLAHWPTQLLPTRFRIRRNSHLAPFLTPNGWNLTAVDLPLDAQFVEGELQVPLDRRLIRPIDQNELVTIIFPEMGLEAELAWPELSLPAENIRRTLVGPTKLPVPQVVDEQSDIGSARSLLTPAPITPPPPPATAPPPEPAAANELPHEAQGRGLAEEPLSKPWRRRLAWAAIILIGAAIGGIWSDIVPYSVTLQAPLRFEGPTGGPFAPSYVDVIVRRAPWMERVRSLALREPPRLSTGDAHVELSANGHEVTMARIKANAEALQREPGTYAISFALRQGFFQLPLATPPVELVVTTSATLLVSENRILFTGPQGGPFTPQQATIRISGRDAPGTWTQTSALPNWLALSRSTGPIAPGEDVQVVATLNAPATALTAGNYGTSLRFTDASGRTFPRTVSLQIRPAAPSQRDDLICDEAASFRFDADRVSSRNFAVDISGLSEAQLNEVLRACTAAAAAAPHRRFDLQAGRLLAERAVKRARQNDIRGAQADMEQAMRLWRSAAANGSTYAMNVLGAYFNGTFNRSADYVFVTPDQAQTLEHWRRSSAGGNVLGIHNFAVQQLQGAGIAQDIPQAMASLERSARAGYTRSAFVLGEAYYYGSPTGVQKNMERGLQLLKSVACTERSAMDVLERLVSERKISESDRPRC